MNSYRETQIGYEITLTENFQDAVSQLTEALKLEGFGILTRIDVRATLKEKLNEDFRPYLILGACNPPLAHKALSHNAEIGLLLPCNVTVEGIQNGQTTVRLANPELMLSLGIEDDPILTSVAQEAARKIKNVAVSLAQLSERPKTR